MPTIKKLSIKDNETGLYDTRDVGIEAQNGIVSYDNSGNIIEDIGSAAVSTTSSIATALKDIHDDFAPKTHATSNSGVAASYGKASTSNWGHVKVTNGTGITVSNGEIGLNLATSADTAAGKIVQANDARLSDKRTPKSHVATDTTYGAATTAQYGHVKVGTGLSVSNGVISVKYSTSATAGNAVEANDARLSNTRTPTAHATSKSTYGVGNSTNFGHVQLTDSPASGNSASTGVGASGKSVYNLQTSFTNTGVKHTKDTAVGSTTKPIYVTSAGNVAACKYEIHDLRAGKVTVPAWSGAGTWTSKTVSFSAMSSTPSSVIVTLATHYAILESYTVDEVTTNSFRLNCKALQSMAQSSALTFYFLVIS